MIEITDQTILNCGHTPTPHSPFTTGYGVDAQGKKSCYACCAKHERETMDATGRATMYISKDDSGAWVVTDWPGMLSYPAYGVRTSWHNIAGKNGRVDFWFRDHAGRKWHGYQIGTYNQVAHCKRLK